MATALKILALEPYLALSHQLFLEGLRKHSRHEWIIESLPARKWKWRMRTAALAFAETVTRHRPDLLVVSDYMNLAELAAIVPSLPPSIVYFHENQLSYPLRDGERRDHHFALTHLYAILSARAVFFNSRYHLESFFGELSKLAATIPDLDPHPFLRTAYSRAELLPVGTDVGREDEVETTEGSSSPGRSIAKVAEEVEPDSPGHPSTKAAEAVEPGSPGHDRTGVTAPVILWAHRWEYDKDPETFVRAMETLAREGEDFQLRVLGQRFRTIPSILTRLKERLGDRLLDLRFLENRREYLEALASCDLVLSTARHEFFGLGTLEALRLGLYPVLPDDLAYPELLPPALSHDRRFLYRREEGPIPALREALRTLRGENLSTASSPSSDASGDGEWNTARREILRFTEGFRWSRLAPAWDERLEALAQAEA